MAIKPSRKWFVKENKMLKRYSIKKRRDEEKIKKKVGWYGY